MMRQRELNQQDLEAFLELRMEFLLSYNVIPDENRLRNDTRRYLERYLETEDLFVLGTEENGELIAACMVCLYDTSPTVDNPTGRYGELRNVYTKPPYRGRGIAKALVLESMETARKRGAGKMRLHYTEDGLPLYQKLGFLPEENYMEKDL
ncbi:GNAT family N-acetyltransferase [Anaerotignum lactatifermentans]|uniref:GNAT family N-acetyltransferase n=1 Tax=Anaerotignum lactatifermentans TaxID=160404 RepID=A0ABS2G8T7_9FIRM|nr:GNAT family N-acetyltransferase [Anaerotignum lactatifermentans]MBM6829767.1 GNAT family N-acetyltransferase [Anaerotignum lactatifermentans]MBM6877188.1 GNAT family N-acetyltransferase [Anaerotignum lactatifermentans]MBM6951426.1 GNAT family N-acetyltransferase [Anaerotignum lactatifermentans]